MFLSRIDQTSSVYTDCTPLKERFGYHHPVTFSCKFTYVANREDLQALEPVRVTAPEKISVVTGREGAIVPTAKGLTPNPKLSTKLESNHLLWYPPDDPVESLDVGASWHFSTLHDCLSIVKDGIDVTDENVIKAPHWHLRCTFDEKPVAYLTQRLKFLGRVAKRSEEYASIGRLFASPPPSVQKEEEIQPKSPEADNYVHSVNTGMMTAVNVVTRSLGPEFLESEKIPSPSEVDASIRDIFGISPTGRKLDRVFTESENDFSTLPSVKGAPPRSLLAFFLVHLLNTPINLRSLGLLWGEFVKELREF